MEPHVPRVDGARAWRGVAVGRPRVLRASRVAVAPAVH
jgi:hypothetical protein